MPIGLNSIEVYKVVGTYLPKISPEAIAHLVTLPITYSRVRFPLPQILFTRMARTKQTARKAEGPSDREIKMLRDIRDHCRDVIVKRKNIYKEDYIVKRPRTEETPPSPKTLLKQELADAKLEIQVLRQEVRWAGQRQDAVKKRVRNIYELAHAVDDDIKSLEKRDALRAGLNTEQDVMNILSGSESPKKKDKC